MSVPAAAVHSPPEGDGGGVDVVGPGGGGFGMVGDAQVEVDPVGRPEVLRVERQVHPRGLGTDAPAPTLQTCGVMCADF